VGSASTNALIGLLDASIEQYRSELETAPAERVVELQIAIRQCRALKPVLMGHAQAQPCI
jgi:DNA-binding transcriptional regulator YdaS (Cro superfamily)